MGGVADPEIYAQPHTCYHAKFDISVTKGVRINKRKPYNWGALEHRSLGIGAWRGWTLKTSPAPCTCYHVKFASLTSKRVCIKWNLRNSGALEPCFLAAGAWLTRRNTSLPILPNLVILGRTVRALLRWSPEKIWALAFRLSRSLEVIGTDTDRSATFDFLLTFHLIPFPR